MDTGTIIAVAVVVAGAVMAVQALALVALSWLSMNRGNGKAAVNAAATTANVKPVAFYAGPQGQTVTKPK